LGSWCCSIVYISYYSVHGGRSNAGNDCGVFYVVANGGASAINWYVGAALSFSNYMKTIK
jgi:hypothetical protein